MDPWGIALAVVAVAAAVGIGVSLISLVSLRSQVAALVVRTAQIATLTQDGFDLIAVDLESVVGVRDSMDQEIRERQGAVGAVERLVARQGRVLAEHVESNLHR